MATTIDLGDGRFIIGDPPKDLPDGHHRCEWCMGEGLDYTSGDDIETCGGCFGTCTRECDDPDCLQHRT